MAKSKPRAVDHLEVESNGDCWTVVSVDTKDKRSPVGEYADERKARRHVDRVNRGLRQRRRYWDLQKSNLLVDIDKDRDPAEDPETNKNRLAIDPLMKNWGYPNSRLRKTFSTCEEAATTIIERYKGGYAVSTIGRNFGVRISVIRMLLKENDVEIRTKRRRGLQNARPGWEETFARPTQAALYWAGFLMADGSIGDTQGEATISCGLSVKDRGHVEALAAFVGRGEGVYARAYRKEHGGIFAWKIGSDRIAADLARWGIVPRKGRLGYTAPKGDALDSVDFWRGVIDGDGSLGWSGKSPQICLTGRRGICEAFTAFVEKHVDLHFYKRDGRLKVVEYDENGACRVILNGGNAVRLAKLLYGTAPKGLYLKRKCEEALEMIRKCEQVIKKREQAVKKKREQGHKMIGGKILDSMASGL